LDAAAKGGRGVDEASVTDLVTARIRPDPSHPFGFFEVSMYFRSISFAALIALATAHGAVSQDATPPEVEAASGEATSSAEANRLFALAVSKYTASQTAIGEDKWELLREVDTLLKGIAETYPTSIPGTRILSDQPLGPIDMTTLQAALAEAPPLWFELVVPGGMVGAVHRHGEFAVAAQRTYAGVDIGGDCGLPVLAPLDGTVTHVVKSGDPDFDRLGNAVAIEHPLGADQRTWTVYLFMDQSPAVAVGPVEAGTKLGLTGRTGLAESCGVHFEVRRFEGEQGFFYPDWQAITGLGNWSEDLAFRAHWLEPEPWLQRLARIASGDGAGKLAYFVGGKRYFWLGDEDQGLALKSYLSLTSTESGLLVSASITPSHREGAAANPVKHSEEFDLRVALIGGKDCEGCQPITIRESEVEFSYSFGEIRRTSSAQPFVVSPDAVADLDWISLTLISSNGKIFPFTQRVVLRAQDPEAPKSPPLTKVEKDFIASKVLSCWNLGNGPFPWISVRFRLDHQSKPEGTIELVWADTAPEDRIRLSFDTARRAILRCGQQGYGLPDASPVPSQELTLHFRSSSLNVEQSGP